MFRPTKIVRTAKIELLPTKRKAEVLKRVAEAADAAFYTAMEEMFPWFQSRLASYNAAVAATTDKKQLNKLKTDLKTEVKKESTRVAKIVRRMKTCVGSNPVSVADMCIEPVVQGLVKDVEQHLQSYFGLQDKQQNVGYVSRPKIIQDRYLAALDLFESVTNLDEENFLRDELARTRKEHGLRPIPLVRNRDCCLLREKENGPVIACLKIIPESLRVASATIRDGFDAVSGFQIERNDDFEDSLVLPKTSKLYLLVPVAMSKWHEHHFFKDGATLVSGKIISENGRWYLAANIEMPNPKQIPVRSYLGIDRGMKMLAAGSVCRKDGTIIHTGVIADGKVGALIRSNEKENSEAQKQGRSPRPKVSRVDYELQLIANHIVALAKRYGSQVVMEKLKGLTRTITTPRRKGAPHNPWQKSLKTMQLRKLEVLLENKLIAAGLPAPIMVAAGGTSITCAACGHVDKENRKSQEDFHCVSCGYMHNADLNASMIIARRGALYDQGLIKERGDHDVRHREMVQSCQKREDTGLGLSGAFVAPGRFVAAPASGTDLRKRNRKGNVFGGRLDGSRTDERDCPVQCHAEHVQKVQTQDHMTDGEPIFLNSNHDKRVACHALNTASGG